MATSSKVLWNLTKLQEEALRSIDERIARKVLEVESYDDDDALRARVAEWRAAQEAHISDMFRRLGDGGLDDFSLSKFKLDPMPKVDRWDRNKAERELSQLQARRSKIVAKSSSLVTDDDGNIALTKTQLAEFFDL
jgi:hypothetical protein